ncbi:MAG: PHP domain-containing protein [Desulfobacteraceae bacterium]|nr:PHP domain-containing protein [Desulfobacteraceae bacterium]
MDLHIHSSASDGSLSPVQILHQAVACELSAIAITDHDTVAGAAAALENGIPKELEFLTGVELSAGFPDEFANAGSMHVLGYGIDIQDRQLCRVLEKQQKARSGRNPAIIERLNQLGCRISLQDVSGEAGKDAIARPHIAASLVRKGYATSIDDAFDRYLGKGQPAYVDKFRIPAEEGIAAIARAGGIAVLAHPGLLADDCRGRLEELIPKLTGMGLSGIEVYYPGHTAEQAAHFEGLCRKFGLLMTGGTDFHGDINPQIQMGCGLGDLHVPHNLYRKLTEALTQIPTQ